MPFAAQEIKNNLNFWDGGSATCGTVLALDCCASMWQWCLQLAAMLAAVRLVEPLVINSSAQLVLLIVAVLVVVLVCQW